MIDKILVPTDGSEHAQPAIEYALDLAEVMGAELHALYVAETEASYVFTVDLDEEAMEELEEYGEEQVRAIIEDASDRGLSGTGAVSRGAVAEEIVEYANDRDMDQIVIGRQGRGAIEQYLGSTAEKVVRMSDVPVTVVRSE